MGRTQRLHFGTESIPQVDKIVGPGNIYACCDDGEDRCSETIFYKDGTAYIVNLDETFIWNQQLFDENR